MSRILRLRIVMVGVLAVACHGRHEHEDSHGHGHGASEELPGQSVTIWTNKHELFMEYQPLIVGKETSFAAHLTDIPSFKAVAEGNITISVQGAGAPIAGKAEAPEPAGIFRPKVTPTTSGDCVLILTVSRTGIEDRIEAGPCKVFPDAASARKELGEEEEPAGRITYLKEQAWKTDFGTVAVATKDLQPGVRAHGEIRPAVGKEARLSAPTGGRVNFADELPPVIGMRVKKGQLIATIVAQPTGADHGSLLADVQGAKAELQAAEAQVKRSERLLSAQAIPEKQLEEAKTTSEVARARVNAALAKQSQFSMGASGTARGRGAFQIRSPIDGTVVALHVSAGQSVQEGQLVLEVMDLQTIWLVAQVFEADIPMVENASAAWFSVDGYTNNFEINSKNGRLVTVGKVLDPTTRTVPLIFEFQNPDERLRVGQFARVVIATGVAEPKLSIPESALIDDAGKPVAYVQVEGESFERRPLMLGISSNGWVEVVSGVEAGEHVVSIGAYEIKLASSAGSVPAHGHVH